MSDKYYGTIVKVIDEYTVVLNKGASAGVVDSSAFLIVEVGEELIDPETGSTLGHLELTKGWCKPTHIQDKMSTIISKEFSEDKGSTEITKSRNRMSIAFGGESVTEVTKPGQRYRKELGNVKVGDRVMARGIKPLDST